MEKSGNIKPKTKWDYFKSAPRPLLKYVCVPLIVVGCVSDTVSLDKFKAILAFAILAFGIRGGEKIADMITSRQTKT